MCMFKLLFKCGSPQICRKSGSNEALNAVVIKPHFVNFAVKISHSYSPLLATDGFSMAHYEKGRMATEQEKFPLLGNCLTNTVERSFSCCALFYPS